MSCVHTACSAAGTRSDAALHRVGPGLDSTAKTGDSGAGAGGHVGEGHEELALGELTISLSCSHLRPKAMRVSVSAGRSGREGCVPAAQSRRMPERTLGLLYSLAKGGGWASAPRQLMRPHKGTTLEACGRRGG